MNTELLEALTILEVEKDISRDTLMDAIENSLINACKNHFGKADNIKVIMDKETCDYTLIQEKTVVEEVEDKVEQISLADAKMIDPSYEIGYIVQIPVESKSFGRIATQNAKNLILQKIREEERKVVYDQYFEKEKDIVTGVVQRYIGKNVRVNLGKADAILTENEQVKGEKFEPTERIKLYVVEVKNTTKGPKILVSRTHPELVKRLENIPLILIDPIWLAATGKAGVNIVTMFDYHRFLFYKDLYAEIGVFGPPSLPSYERARFLVEAYERSYLNGSPISLAAMCDWLDRSAAPEARELRS